MIDFSPESTVVTALGWDSSHIFFLKQLVFAAGGEKCLNAEAEIHMFIYSCNHQIQEVEKSITHTHARWTICSAALLPRYGDGRCTWHFLWKKKQTDNSLWQRTIAGSQNSSFSWDGWERWWERERCDKQQEIWTKLLPFRGLLFFTPHHPIRVTRSLDAILCRPPSTPPPPACWLI